MDGLAGVTEMDANAYPSPLSETVCGMDVLSLMVMVPVLLPVEPGANRKVSVQLSPFLRLVGQVSLERKSVPGPVIAMFLMVLPLLLVMVSV